MPGGQSDGPATLIHLSGKGDFDISVNCIKMRNPADMLEKFSLIREDGSLSDAEKDALVRKAVIEYME